MISDPSLTTTLDIPETFVFPVVLNDDNFNDYIEDLEGAEISDRYGVIIHAEDVENLESRHNYIILTMYSESLSFYDAVKVDFVITEDGRIWTEFDLPIKCHQINIWLSGKFTLTHLEVYAVSRSASIATTTTLGIVRPREDSAISVLANKKVDDAGNIIGEAGDIDVKVGAGLAKDEKGNLAIAGLSSSCLKSLTWKDDGFIVNETNSFKRVAEGLLHVETGTTIIIKTEDGNIEVNKESEATENESGGA